jgi:hypothetical protein
MSAIIFGQKTGYPPIGSDLVFKKLNAGFFTLGGRRFTIGLAVPIVNRHSQNEA